MTRKARILLQNFCYHVIVQGNQQQFTFLDDEDFHKVLKFLKKYKLKFKMEIYAYCIMGNHMHLLLNPSKSDILKKFMHGIKINLGTVLGTILHRSFTQSHTCPFFNPTPVP